MSAGLPENVLGLLSLFFWSLTLVVTLKYVAVLMQADNKGQGGIMPLLSLVPPEQRRIVGTRVNWVTLLVVMGAIEGLKRIDPRFAWQETPFAFHGAQLS